MGNKTRHTANLVSDNNLFVDIANDRVGIGSTQPTAKLNVAGIVSATSFRGDGSQLSGISVDSSSLVDSNSATRVQANAAGAVVTGILTATKLFGDASNVTGIVTTNLGKANVTISDAPPGIGTAHGDLWWESDTAKGHIYYNDGSSAQWVEFTPSSGGGGGGGGGSYGNADVDSHLNISGASSGQILSWNGYDYAWVADQTGGGGSGITTANINADTINSGTLNVTGVSTFTADKVFFKNGGTPLPATLQIETGVGGIGNTIRSSGSLELVTNGSAFKLELDTTNAIIAGGTGAAQYVQLFGTGSEKLKTIGTGVTVTGTTFSNQLNVSGISSIGGNIIVGHTTPGTGSIIKAGSINLTGPNSTDSNSTFYPNIRLNKVGNGFKYDLEFHSNGYSSSDIGDFIFYKRQTSAGRSERMRLTGEDGNLTVTGSVTASSFSGSGANLTNLPAVNVTGNLNGVTDITCNSIINNAGGGATWALYNGGNANFTSSVTASSFVKSGGTSSQYLMADGSVSVGAGSTNLVTTWTLGANGSSDYTFTGPGVADGAQDPTIYLVRGQTYKFENRSGGHPFRIQYEFQNTGGTAYNDGIVNNAANHNTDLYWEVRNDAPDLLHYQCTSHGGMSGRIVILGDVVNSGSWTASAGTAQTIDTITGVANNAIKTAEYTIHIENGSNMQAQKVLVMQDGTTAFSQEYAIMHKSGLLVSMSATISGGNLLLQATPETGVSGTTTYKVTRQTMR